MPSDAVNTQATTKSPIFAAVGLSLAIGLGAVLGTSDIGTIEDAISGRWLTRPYTETLQGHTVAIAVLESSIGGVTRDIDFVASRASASIRRNEDQSAERFKQIDAEIAALKDKLTGVQLTQLITSHADQLGESRGRPALLAHRTDHRAPQLGRGDHAAARPDRGEGRALDRCHRAGCQFRAQDCPPRREDETADRAPAQRSDRFFSAAALSRAPVQREAGQPAASAAAPDQAAGLTLIGGA